MTYAGWQRQAFGFASKFSAAAGVLRFDYVILNA